MSFSLDTRHTKYLPDYAAALAHHDSIKPIRNSNCRPIAERTKQHFNIRTQTNALSDKTKICKVWKFQRASCSRNKQ